jgi:hypothetical protein
VFNLFCFNISEVNYIGEINENIMCTL